MKDFKDFLLYLQTFDKINMFDLEHNFKINFVSEVLRSVMCRRIKKFDLIYCGDVILDLIDLTVKLTGMVVMKKRAHYKKSKKLRDGVLLYGCVLDIGFVYSSLFEYNVLSEDSDTGGWFIGFWF